jgi:HSP20 family molecular chaperone IbpA
MVRRRVRPLGGGIPPDSRGRIPGSGDIASAVENLREVAERLEPIGARLDEVRGEIAERLVSSGVVEGVREVAIDVFDEGDEIVAVAELPGLTEAEIAVAVDGRELTIDGLKAGRRFSGSVVLPAEVMTGWVLTTRNGVVEMRFRKRKEGNS